MFVWKEWLKQKSAYGIATYTAVYKMLLLFGIIPIFVYIKK